MRLISRVEISHFRSFAGKEVVDGCSNINVFSGKNDSGKSNILRALNLFFTEDRVDFYNRLDFSEDFSKQRREVVAEQTKGKQLFSVGILFNRLSYESTVLPESFLVVKIWDREGNVTRKVKDSKTGKLLSGRSKFDAAITRFLNKISYSYIPAVRDEVFYGYLKREYLRSLTQKIQKVSSSLAEAVNEESTVMMQQFSKLAPEVTEAVFGVPSSQIDFSSFLDVVTEGEKSISLRRRGDGVQAKFIPQILDNIDKNENAKFNVWGFEEPENSLEYKNMRLLVDSFMKKYRDKQVFMTSHAFTFTSLKDQSISQYRVYKNNFKEGTRVAKIKQSDQALLFADRAPDDVALEEELGLVDLNHELRELYDRRFREIELICKQRRELELMNKPVLLVEDKIDRIYKIAWLKLYDHRFAGDEIDTVFERNAPFVIQPMCGAGGVAGLLRMKMPMGPLHRDKRICGLFDFDGEGCEQFKMLARDPELWGVEPSGEKASGFYKVCLKHQSLSALLLPVPERLHGLVVGLGDDLKFNLIEVENLLNESFLIENGFVEEKKLPGGSNNVYLRMRDDRKGALWKALVSANRDIFTDFKPLFDRVYELLQIN